jgi:5-methylcytosine-specific restriction endonuclease McrA
VRAGRRPCPRGHGIVRGPCPHCRRLYELGRGGARVRGYDTLWDAFAAAWLRRFPWCGQRADGRLYGDDSRCVRAGRRVPGAVADHIVPLRRGGAHRAPGNTQSLCVGCNTAKSAKTAPFRFARNSTVSRL